VVFPAGIINSPAGIGGFSNRNYQ
jgi:hypothetical protein